MLSIRLVLIFMIVAAAVAVEIKDGISSIIALGAVGLGLSLGFLLLRAPDLAIILLIVEIITLATLMRTVSAEKAAKVSEDRLSSVTALAFVVLFAMVGYFALQSLPVFGSPLLRVSRFYLQEGASKLGAENIVASIALGYRSFDSLAALSVLFLVAIGVASIMGRRKEDGK